jgi:lysophospholipase
MGGAVALDYLERYPSPFQAVVVSAPMLRINTAPYPETVTRGIVGFLHSIGLGDHYVIGKHDRYGDEPFEGNKLTSSKDRWNAIQSTWMNHPEAVTGGPSNDWVEQAIDRTAFIRARLSGIKSRVLILQAGKDEFVLNPDQDLAQEKIPGSRLTKFPDAHHEILFEKDPIRNQAITQILNFYGN